MIKIMYNVSLDNKESEIQWLKEQKIYPCVQDTWDWRKGMTVVFFGVIVSPEAALSIKLRHPLEFQKEYTQR